MASADTTTQTRTRADPTLDLALELYMIDGEVPPDMLQACVEWLRRNPAELGLCVGDILERTSLDAAEAAAHLGVERANLEAVIGAGHPWPSTSRSGWKRPSETQSRALAPLAGR